MRLVWGQGNDSMLLTFCLSLYIQCVSLEFIKFIMIKFNFYTFKAVYINSILQIFPDISKVFIKIHLCTCTLNMWQIKKLDLVIKKWCTSSLFFILLKVSLDSWYAKHWKNSRLFCKFSVGSSKTDCGFTYTLICIMCLYTCDF